MGIAKDDILDRLRGKGAVLEFLERCGTPALRQGNPRKQESLLLCPFHDDHTPSCGVYTEDGGHSWAFKCLSCGAGGDMIVFAAWIGGVVPVGSKVGRDDFDAVMAWMGRTLGVSEREGTSGAGGGGRPSEEVERENAERRATEAARKAAADATAQAYRDKSVEQARTLWRRAVEPLRPGELDLGGGGIELVAAYLSGRGIPTAPDPTVVPVHSLRGVNGAFRKFYTGETHRTRATDERAYQTTTREFVPAVLCAGRDQRGAVQCVQRIFIDPEGLRAWDQGGRVDPKAVRKITYGLDAKGGGLTKQTLGTKAKELGGVAVRLSPPPPDGSGVLAVCEGIETGWALRAALGDAAAVWALIDVEVMRFFALAPWMVAPEIAAGWVKDRPVEARQEAADLAASATPPGGGGGWVRKVIVAGDLDRSKAGQKGARTCASNLLTAWGHYGLEVTVALPTHEVAPALVTKRGAIAKVGGGAGENTEDAEGGTEGGEGGGWGEAEEEAIDGV